MLSPDLFPSLFTMSADVTTAQNARCRDVTRLHQSGVNKGERYKTELCRTYEEIGCCRYGDKCQFAHGVAELRTVQRHPKYKTDLCRTFHTTGFCPYGARCHFIHGEPQQQQHQVALSSHSVTSSSPPSSPSLSSSPSSPLIDRQVPDIGRLLGGLDSDLMLQVLTSLIQRRKQNADIVDLFRLGVTDDNISPRLPSTCQQMSASGATYSFNKTAAARSIFA